MPPTIDTTQETSNIQCYCISINVYSEPSPCPSSPALDFASAQHLARTLNLPLQVLDEDTLTGSEIPISLRSSSEESHLAGQSIVCGVEDQIRQAYHSAFQEHIDSEVHNDFVNRVGAALILVLLLLVCGHLLWNRHLLREWYSALEQEDTEIADNRKHREEDTLHEDEIYIVEWIEKSQVTEDCEWS